MRDFFQQLILTLVIFGCVSAGAHFIVNSIARAQIYSDKMDDERMGSCIEGGANWNDCYDVIIHTNGYVFTPAAK